MAAVCAICGSDRSEPLIARRNTPVFQNAVYPDAATMAKLFVITARDPATQRVINRLWTRVKTGR